MSESEYEEQLSEDKSEDDQEELVIEEVTKGRKRKSKNFPGRKRCPYGCHKLLAFRTLEYHRTNGCRGAEEPLGDSRRKRDFCCGICYQTFFTRVAFFDHLNANHDIQSRINKLTFPDKAIFDRFIRWLEKEGGAHFRFTSGGNIRANGKSIFMTCNRSGSTYQQPKKRPATFVHLDYTCSAFISGNHRHDGSVTIEFCGDHYGHDARMRLPQIIKQLIAQKQLEGEMAQDIIGYLRRQFGALADSNFFAKRVCAVDADELRTLMVTSTRKWESTGIPNECEIWEEELLDAVGISRDGVERLRQEGEKTTDQLAQEYNWPLPHNFHVDRSLPHVFPLSPVSQKAAILHPDSISLVKTEEPSLQREIKREEPIILEPTIAIKMEEALQQETEDISVDVETLESGGEKHAESEAGDSVIDVTTPCPKDVRKVWAKRPERPLNRAGVLKNMGDDLVALDQMIRNHSEKVSGPCLVAYLTRVRAIRSSYEATIAAARRAEAQKVPTMAISSEEGEELDGGKTENPESLTSAIPILLFNKDLWA